MHNVQSDSRTKLHNVQKCFLLPSVTFAEALKQTPAAQIAAIVGCPERTVYAWRAGKRIPSDWVQRLVLDVVAKTKAEPALSLKT
jgi:hypothetical protein